MSTTEIEKRIMSKEEAAARLLQHLGRRFIKVNRKRNKEENQQHIMGLSRLSKYSSAWLMPFLIREQVLNGLMVVTHNPHDPSNAVLEDLLDEHLRCDIIPDLLIEVCLAPHE